MPFFRKSHIGLRLAGRAAMFFALFALLIRVLPNALAYDVLSSLVSATALGVLTAYIPGIVYLVVHNQEPASSDYLVMGICSGWLARDGQSTWGWAWRFVGRPDWMPDHWFPLSMLALTLLSAALHLTADAVDGVIPRRVWVIRGVVVATVLSICFIGIAWNLSHGGYPPDPPRLY
jgi:hypothetical protein